MFFKQNNILYTFSLIALLVVSSCKTAKPIGESKANLGLSAKQLINENSKLKPDFKTLQAKLKITYSQGQKEQTHTVSYRMKKDEVIWISAPFSLIRAKITPKNVAFYNKLDNTYFEGDYKYLSNLLGTELDFQKAQNLLLGEAIFNLKNENYKLSMHQNHYVLQPKKQRELFEIFFLINPSHYKISSQQISQSQELRHLQIDYKLYQDIDNQKIPELIKIVAVDKTEETSIGLEFKSVALNTSLRFPFNIPSGFDKIEL